MRKLILFSLGIALSAIMMNTGYAATVTTTCSPSQVANSCDQCFYSDSNVYLGYNVSGFYDVWYARANPDEIYLNENPSPVRFHTNFPNEVTQYGTMTALWQGTSYTDPTYGPYIPFAANSSGVLLRLDPSYRVGLTGISPALMAAGRSTPIFGLDYIINYWEVGNATPIEHKECIVYYGAWCGDGTIDSTRGETCDDGAQNGQPGRCNATCTGPTPPTPVPGVCGSADGVAVSSAPAASLCSAGTAGPVTGTGPWAWSCIGTNSGATANCSAPVLPPPPPAPVCSSTVIGAISAPITTGACNVGTVVSFASTGSSPVHYTWNCRNTANQIVNCSANYTPPPPVDFALSLKKYINSSDAQPSMPVSVRTGDAINYIIRVTNNGPGNITGTTTVSDLLPLGVALNGTPSGTGWTCGVIGIGVTCTTTASVGVGVSLPDITIPVRVTATTGMVTNTALVSNPADSSSTPGDNTDPGVFIIARDGVCSSTVSGALAAPITAGSCNFGNPSGFTASGSNPISYTWNCSGINGGNPSPVCSASHITASPFALAIKKYVDGNDAQSVGSGYIVTPGQTITYRLEVRNTGTGPVTGVTTVRDVLDSNLTYSGAASFASGDWTCNYTAPNRTLSCTSSATPAAGASFAPISFQVRVSLTATGNIQNIATVSNPNDSSSTPGDDSDPAIIIISTIQPNLTIKKYAKDLVTGDTQSSPISVTPGETFSYYYVFRNTGSGSATGVVIKDTFPEHLSHTGNISVVRNSDGIDVTSDWNCIKGIYPSTTRITLVCTKRTALEANSPQYTMSVPVTVSSTIPSGVSLQNIAYICADNSSNNPTGPNGEVVCGNTNPPPPPPPTGCTDISNPQRDPACITVGNPSLSIRKAAQGQDGQTLSDAAQVTPGSAFSYTYVVTNSGNLAATGVTITDTFPQYVSVTARPTGTDWTCNNGTKTLTGVTYHTVICSYNRPLPAGSSAPVVTVPALVSASTPDNTALRNVAYVCAEGILVTPGVCSPTCTDINNGSCTPPPPPPDCNANDVGPGKDPACVVATDRKRCDTLTSNPSGATQAPGTSISYQCTAAGSGLVTANLEYRITCGSTDTSATYTTGSTKTCVLPNTNSASQTVTCSVRDRSTGVVYSGSDAGSCSVTKSTTGGGGGGGGTLYYVPTCANGLNACSTQVHLNQNACEVTNGVGRCFTTAASCAAANTLVCSGPGGPGPGGPGSPGTGFCGDGVLQPAGRDGGYGTSDDEECDVRNATWCDNSCKILITTNPGANPIADMWMTIPALSNARLGYSWLDVPGRIRFSDNRMVLGVGTSAFTVADTVGFGITTQESLPLIIDADKRICLVSGGTSLNNNQVCTYFGTAADGNHGTFVHPTGVTVGKRFIVLGRGYYQVPTGRDPVSGAITYTAYNANFSNNITLFRAGNSNMYYNLANNTSSSLSQAFRGAGVGNDGTLSLYHYTADGSGIDLVRLDVQVSGAMAGSTSSTLARGIEIYVKPTSAIEAFLSSFKSGFGRVGTTAATTTVSTSTANTATNTNTLTSGSLVNLTVSSLLGLEAYRVNGNPNVYAVRGNVTLNCTSGNSATVLSGVKTLVVEGGNLTINCNNSYTSGDASASWAFIVRGGNIQVNPNVTSLVGVYVAIPNSNIGGKITGTSNAATNNIVTINGSLYGDTSGTSTELGLFASRAYLRGNNAYDMLTTGVILSYSPRALNNPPPLLAQYLSNYSVTRVVR